MNKRRGIGWMAVMAAGCVGVPLMAAAAERPMVRWHAVGGQGMRQQLGAPQLKAALTHPDAAGVGGRAATNLAQFVVHRITGADDAARTRALHPLAEALLDHESLG